MSNPKNRVIFGFPKKKGHMFDEKDLEQFKKKGTNADNVKAQLELIKNGFPYLELEAAASVGNGILAVDDSQCAGYIKTWDTYCSSGHKVTKFVPASGAASRMFKDLFAFLDAQYDVPTTPFEKAFFDGIEKFAFYKDLDAACSANEDKSIRELISAGNYKAVVANLLGAKGLNYGALPREPTAPYICISRYQPSTAIFSVNWQPAAPRLCPSATVPLMTYHSLNRSPAPIPLPPLPTAQPSVMMTAPSCSVPEVTVRLLRT